MSPDRSTNESPDLHSQSAFWERRRFHRVVDRRSSSGPRTSDSDSYFGYSVRAKLSRGPRQTNPLSKPLLEERENFPTGSDLSGQPSRQSPYFRRRQTAPLDIEDFRTEMHTCVYAPGKAGSQFLPHEASAG